MDASQTLPRRADDQRVHAILTAYAEDVVQLDLRIADLEADVGTYREIAVALMDGLSDLTARYHDLQAENQDLDDKNRQLLRLLHVEAGAGVWGEEEPEEVPT